MSRSKVMYYLDLSAARTIVFCRECGDIFAITKDTDMDTVDYLKEGITLTCSCGRVIDTKEYKWVRTRNRSLENNSSVSETVFDNGDKIVISKMSIDSMFINGVLMNTHINHRIVFNIRTGLSYELAPRKINYNKKSITTTDAPVRDRHGYAVPDLKHAPIRMIGLEDNNYTGISKETFLKVYDLISMRIYEMFGYNPANLSLVWGSYLNVLAMLNKFPTISLETVRTLKLISVLAKTDRKELQKLRKMVTKSDKEIAEAVELSVFFSDSNPFNSHSLRTRDSIISDIEKFVTRLQQSKFYNIKTNTKNRFFDYAGYTLRALNIPVNKLYKKAVALDIRTAFLYDDYKKLVKQPVNIAKLMVINYGLRSVNDYTYCVNEDHMSFLGELIEKCGETIAVAKITKGNTDTFDPLAIGRTTVVDDTVQMFRRAVNEGVYSRDMLVGNMEEIHDEIQGTLIRSGHKNKYTNEVIHVTTEELMLQQEIDGYSFLLAEDTDRLTDLTEIMHICVGYAYRSQALNKECTIVYVINSKGRYEACIELREVTTIENRYCEELGHMVSEPKLSFQLWQCKARYNHRTEGNVKAAVYKWMEENNINDRSYDLGKKPTSKELAILGRMASLEFIQVYACHKDMKVTDIMKHYAGKVTEEEFAKLFPKGFGKERPDFVDEYEGLIPRGVYRELGEEYIDEAEITEVAEERAEYYITED